MDWGDTQGLSFSPPKTVAVLFSRKHAQPTTLPIYMKGVHIPLSNQVKYLGLLLDRKLNWQIHLKWKIKQAKGLLLKLANSAGKLWGLSPKWMRWAYTGVVRPALTYGALVWTRGCLLHDGSAVNQLRMKTTLRVQLERVNRLALMLLGHFRRSTPTGGLEVIGHIMPLDLYIIKTALLAFLRTRANQTWLEDPSIHSAPSDSYVKLYMDLLTSMSLDQIRIDRVADAPLARGGYQVSEERRAQYHPIPGRDCLTFYTDGSVGAAHAGSGYVMYEDTRLAQQSLFTLEPTTAHFAEVYAIQKVAEHLLGVASPKLVTIFTDSKHTLRALNDRWSTSGLIIRTSSALAEAGTNHQIFLRWVPAHKGHLGNELADDLARQGASGTQAPVPDQPGLPWPQVKKEVHSRFLAWWDDRWSTRTDCRQTKLWLPSTDSSRAFTTLQLNRRQFSLMVQIVTGHNYLRYHSGLVDSLPDDSDYLCRYCWEDDETSSHIVADCPAMEVARATVFKTLKLAPPLSCSYSRLRKFFREANVTELWGCFEEDLANDEEDPLEDVGPAE